MGRASDYQESYKDYQFLSDMGRLAQMFPRFPHRCIIYTMQNPTGFESEEELKALKKVIWKGRCRKESNTSIRTFKGTENVLKGDYRVQLGALVGGNLAGDANAAPDGRTGEECGAIVCDVKAGMFIDFYDRNNIAGFGTSSDDSSSSEEEEPTPTCTLNLNDSYAGNLGTTLYCDEYKT